MSEQTNLQIALQRIAEVREKDSKHLDLTGLGLTKLPPEVCTFRDLEVLLLGQKEDEQIQEPGEINQLNNLPDDIGNLTNLRELCLSRNQLQEIPNTIKKLSKLEYLNISDNKFTKFPLEICFLPRLKELWIHRNNIDSIPDEIANLKHLEKFYIFANNIKSIPPAIGELPELIVFDAGHLELRKLPVDWQVSRSLETLVLSLNNLQLPKGIFDLPNLKTLVVRGIKNLPSELGKLENLELLRASGKFARIPKEIGSLKKLKELHISSTKITDLPVELGSLSRLEILEIRNTQVSSLPSTFRQLSQLRKLRVSQNRLPIPPEILERSSEPQSILNYYFSVTETNRKPLNEIKIILVGQGSVGKTSLVERILHNRFDKNQTKTEGISIVQWNIDDGQQANSPVKLNMWDFGGQEIMHATHQFFLTKRSLYLLVLDARLTQEENRVEYWLKIIQSFGGESPVLIVGNKTDQHPLDIDRTGLQKKYPNIVCILETSAATGAGIDALKAEIAKQVDTLPHVRDLLPETWFKVKSNLEELGRDKNFITQDEYLGLCGANDVTDETSQHTLIGFLHDLGVVLHFQDDPRLEALGILNPQWVTNGVYKILNSHELFQNQGTLTMSMLNKILNLPEYPSNKRLFIVDMMKKFELCYDIEPDKSFLVPDLLPKDEIYTGDWDNALEFQYHYNVLPSSIISRFIVRMNAFIHKNTIWRSGVVLKRGDNTALVKADTEDRKIYIWVAGKEDTRRDLLAMIRGEFDAIHKTIAKIEATEKVPLPNAPEAAPVDLTFLQQAASEGRESLPVQVGNRIIDLIVKEVLSQIEKEGKGSLPSTNIYNISGNVYGAVGSSNTVNFIQQKFEPIYEAIEASSRNVTDKQDLVAEVDEIKDEVAKGEQANESFLSRRLRNLKKMAPDIAEVALSALAGPGAAISAIVKNIARQIKEETI